MGGKGYDMMAYVLTFLCYGMLVIGLFGCPFSKLVLVPLSTVCMYVCMT